MDHIENFEFCIGNLSLQGINGILGRDWLRKHKPYIDYGNNHIYFLDRHCRSHCPSSRRNKLLTKNSEITAPMVEKESTTTDDAPNTADTVTDTIAPPEFISEDELI